MSAANNGNRGTVRYFVTYSGVKLPFNLVSELQAGEVQNRNTYFRGYFDEQDRLSGFDKLAYGDIELMHRYAYHDNGQLRSAEINIELMHRYAYHDNGQLRSAEITDIDGETTMLLFNTEGNAA